MEHKSTEAEIDLLGGFTKFCSAVIKNIILIIVCTALGLLFGYLLFATQKPKWEASLMISTDLLSQQEAEFLTNELIESVGSFEGKKVGIKEIISTDKNTENLFLQLAATTDSKDVFPELQKELLNYVNKSEPVVHRASDKKAFLSELINKINIELESLERLKTKLASQANISILNPSDLSGKSVELYDRKIRYQQEFKDLDSVFLVKGFEPKEVTKPIFLFLCLGTALGFFLAALIMFLKFFIPHYRQFVKTQG